MALNKLTISKCDAAVRKSLLNDGGGLCLQVTDREHKSWIFRFTSPLTRRNRYHGLGPYPAVSLAKARSAAAVCRDQLREGLDPIDQRRAKLTSAKVLASNSKTFAEIASEYIREHDPHWKNRVHASQWPSTMRDYAYPVIGELPVKAVAKSHVLEILKPIWAAKHETARRVRMRIEKILDYAAAHGYRDGANPAVFRGNLEAVLPATRIVKKTRKHHAALPYADVPEFMARLRKLTSLSARALELTILAATRTTETLKARWTEIDLEAAVWTIPAERMKANIEHQVPLPRSAVAMLRKLPRDDSGYLFPGGSKGTLSQMAMLELLRGIDAKITVHGFRSTFRDYAAEETTAPNEVCEMALAHKISNAAESAYRRGDLLNKRRALMQQWADWCDGAVAQSATVTMLRRA